MTEMKARTFQRVDAADTWELVDSVLGKGEIGVDVTNNQFRVGDGVKRWTELPPVGATAEQIEGLVEAFLSANPPIPSGATTVTVVEHPTIPGAGILSVTTLAAGLSIVLQPQPLDVHVGQAATLSAASSDVSASVQWQISTDGGSSWSDVAGATAATYSPSTASAVGTPFAGPRYRATFTSAGRTATTEAALFRVWNPWTWSQHPQSQTASEGLSVTFTSSGSGAAFSRSWEQSVDGGATWTLLEAGAGDLTISATMAMNGYGFRAVMTHTYTGARFVSNTATLTVTAAGDPPTVTFPTSVENWYTGEDVTFQLYSTADGTPAPTVQWQRSLDSGATWTNVPGATTSQPTLNTATEFGSRVGPSAVNAYRALWTNAAGSVASPTIYVTNAVEA